MGDASAEGPSCRSGAVGVAAAPQPLPIPAGLTAPRMAAKPAFPAGVPGTSAPIPVTAEMPNAASSVSPASFSPANVDPRDLEWVGSEVAIKKAKEDPVPTRMPELVAPPLPVRSAEIVLETKQPPVAVAIDTKSSPTGMPSLRLVNTKRFTLSYTVQDGGAGGTAVDLWETRDSKTWKKCEHAQAQQGAYLVEVKDEGVFGYTMVARPAGDKSNTQPKPGDVPQVWVTVDVTKPTVSVTGVELNLTSRQPNLIVRWSAKDRNFGPRPVTLLYAETTEGPWLPLAANIENSGRFECPVPANMPKRAFLRVEAVDLVGNCGAAQTDKLVRLDFLSPPVANLLPPPPQPAQVTAEVSRPLVIINCVEPNCGTKSE
jgi:hypothetical protein